MTESDANDVFAAAGIRQTRFWVNSGAMAGCAGGLIGCLLFPDDNSVWLFLVGFLVGALPFTAFAYYRMREGGMKLFRATQRTISEIDQLKDQRLWFVTTNGRSLRDTTPKDFYWQIVKSLSTAIQPVAVIDRALSSQRLVTVHRGARSDYSLGIQFVVKSLVDAGAHLEWGRDGNWFIGADFEPVSFTEFRNDVGYVLAETGHHDAVREIDAQRFDSAIRIKNGDADVGLFAILERSYVGVYYHKSDGGQ